MNIMMRFLIINKIRYIVVNFCRMARDGLFLALQGTSNNKHHVEELACAGDLFNQKKKKHVDVD